MKSTLYFIVLTLVLTSPSPDARAQLLDARSVGLGGALAPDTRSADRINPAMRGLPGEARRRYSIRVPFFLLQQLDDRPTLNGGDNDFDLSHVAQWMVKIPAGLQWQRQKPLSESTELVDSGSQWQATRSDLQRDLPPTSFTRGETIDAFDLGYELDLGERHGVVYLSAVQGFAVSEVDVEVSGGYESLLANGAGQATATTRGFLATGFSYGLTYAREVALGNGAGAGDFDDYFDQADARPRLWIGLGLRRLNGLAYARTQGNTTLSSVTGDAASIAVDTVMDYESAAAEGLSRWGGGFAADLGAVLRWRGFEWRAGVADLGASLKWSDADRATISQDPASSVTRSREARSLDLPTRWRVHLRKLAATNETMALIEAGEDAGGFSARSAIETTRGRLGARVGVEFDTRETWQFAGGLSVNREKLRVDVGLRTHSGNLNQTRGVALTMGLSWLR